MDGYSAPGELLTHDVVAMQQITTVLSNEFDILDASGGVIGRVVGTDSLGARLFTGPREFTLHEADGTPLLGIHDVPDFGLDTFALTRPDGGTVATLTKRLALFQTVVDVTAADGSQLSLSGNFWDFEFSILQWAVPVATVTRDWADLGEFFLGHTRYAVVFSAGAPTGTHLTVLGTVVALDLIRRKRRNNS